MGDTGPNGIDLMRRRMDRGQRTPPTPRKPGGEAPRAAVTAADPPPPEATTPVQRATRTAASAVPAPRPALTVGDPPVNLAIRVRRPLDDHLVDVLHRLRRDGVRSSKVELIEMLLWELPADQAAVRERLAAFRRVAPRGGDAL